MIPCSDFVDTILEHGVRFFVGVPDSLLKDVCAYITDEMPSANHIIAANEGNAIALGAGYHLSTGQIPLVYMQNSGLGNAVNPLTSLASKDVYSIPMILMIGWRGEPGVKDEPQHTQKGRITPELLKALEIPYHIIGSDSDFQKIIPEAILQAKEESAPIVFLIKAGTFQKYKLKRNISSTATLTREAAIQLVSNELKEDDVVLATTGKISREFYEHRIKRSGKCDDFLNVGSMGHVSQIALSVALNQPAKKVYCLDGDGSVLMHMGGLAIIGQMQPTNFKHIILNNAAHDSVGGQPTVGHEIDIPQIALACRYKKVFKVIDEQQLKNALHEFLKTEGPCLLEVIVKTGSRDDLGRPKSTPMENKIAFMDKLDV